MATLAAWLWIILNAIPPSNILFVDWKIYALASHRLLEGQSIFLPEQLAGPYHLPDGTIGGYIYTPASAALFVPFAQGQVGLVLWLVASVGLLVSGLAAIIRRELGSIRPVPLSLAILGLTLLVPLPGGSIAAPFPDGVFTGNVTVALAGLRGVGRPANGATGYRTSPVSLRSQRSCPVRL